MLERVINAGLWAPSGTNAQPWEITVLAGSYRDEFVEHAAHCIAHMRIILKEANLPEKGQDMVIKFFQNLGGAPVVIAVTIDKLEDPGIIASVLNRYKTLKQEELVVIEEMTGKLYEKVLGVVTSIP